MGRVDDPAWIPTAADAVAIRDHIASFLQADPRRASDIATRLLHAVQKHAASPSAAVAIAWRAKAESLLFGGAYKAAASAYEKASAFAEASRDDRLLGQILVGRIGTLLVMGGSSPVRSLVRRAETLLQRSGDQDYLLRLHINLGSGHYHREHYVEAHRSYREALNLKEAAGERDALWANLTLNYGIACSQLARIDEAREAFGRVESFGCEHDQQRLTAQAKFNRGALDGLRGSYRAALRLLSEAEETFARQDLRELRAATDLERAQIYLDLSMPSEATELASRAADSFSSEGMVLDAQLAHLAEARGLLLLDRPADAIHLLSEAERFYRARRIPARRAQALLDIGRAWIERDDLGAAWRSAGKALRASDRLNNESLTRAAKCLRADVLLRRHLPVRAERELSGLEDLMPRLPMRDRVEYWTTAARVARAGGKLAAASLRYQRAARCVEAQRSLIPGMELRARSFERDVRVYQEQIAMLADSPRPDLDRVLRLMEQARGRTFRELLAARGRRSDEEITGLRAVLGSMVRRLDHLMMEGQPTEQGRSAQLRRQILAMERDIAARVRKEEASSARSVEAEPFIGPPKSFRC